MTDIEVIGLPKQLATVNDTKWGTVVIGDEIFISSYAKNPYMIQVYDAENGSLKRSFNITGVIPNSYGSLGTDGTVFYVLNSANQIVSVDKTNGSVISVRSTPLYILDRTATFTIDLNRDIIFYSKYGESTSNFYINRFSTGALLNRYSMPKRGTGGGATIYNNSYFVISQYGSSSIFISSNIGDNLDTLTFKELYIYSGALGGIGVYLNRLIFCGYADNKLTSLEITPLSEQRVMLYSSLNNQYYYHDTVSWTSLGTNPTNQQILDYGMTEVNTSQIQQFESIDRDGWIPVHWTDGSSSIGAILKATPYAQILTAKNSIQLTGVVSGSFKWTATGDSRIALSVDDGVTYYAFKNGIWIDVTNDMANAMTAIDYTALTWEQYKLLARDSNFLKHQYYIPDNSTVDDILITAELMGSNKVADSNSYQLVYDQSTKTIRYQISKSGSYFCNYIDVATLY